jgi:hypothetical protein
MSDYGIDIYNFEFWDGPPPPLPTEKVVASTRPGVNGVSIHRMGRWADPFEVTLTSHWASQLAAAAGHSLMRNLIGAGGTYVKYNNLNWTMLHGVYYNIHSIEILDIRSAICLMGPGYVLAGGAALVTRFVMQGQEVL